MRRVHAGRAIRVGRAAAVLGLAGPLLLAGCASEQERYCDQLSESAPQLERLSKQAGRTPAASTLASIPVLTELSEAAPPELEDEWTVVLNALRTFRDAVRRSGVDTGPGAAEAIEQLPAEQRDAVQQAAARLVAPKVVEATRGIEDYGTQVCDEQLGL